MKIDLFQYLDYRRFLKDWYEGKKTARGSFSFRRFSHKAGFNSPNILKMVMEGKRNLTEKSLPKFTKGLGLNKQESDYFSHLVLYNQGETHEKKDFHYRRLLQSRKFNTLKPLEKDRYEYYSTWYHAVIRELITSPTFEGTPEWLVKQISPLLTAEQVSKSIRLLERLGFIEKTADQRYQQTHSLVTTGPESTSLILLNYHQSVLTLVKDLLPTIQPEERDVSALTLGIHKGRLPQLKKKIQEFRQEILKLVSTDDRPEEVALLTMQLFPVTKRKKDEV